MLTRENIEEFRKKGYTLLENALTREEVEGLHEEADILLNYLISEGFDIVKDLGCVIEPWTCGYMDIKTSDYKTNRNVYKDLRDGINLDFSSSSELILNKYSNFASQLLLYDSIYLLNEQFIIKPPKRLGVSEFAWHKDSDYYSEEKHRNIETIACWTALDSMNQDNGTVEIKDFQDNTFKVKLNAGGILFMSNKLLHKSEANHSQQFRRAYMAQFSVEPIIAATTEERVIGLAIQCGRNIL